MSLPFSLHLEVSMAFNYMIVMFCKYNDLVHYVGFGDMSVICNYYSDDESCITHMYTPN